MWSKKLEMLSNWSRV